MLDPLQKRPLEIRTYLFDFHSQVEIQAGELISSIVAIRAPNSVGLTLGTGSIVSVTDRITGVVWPTSGVNVLISNGVPETLYYLFCDILTNGGHKLTCGGKLYVGDVA